MRSRQSSYNTILKQGRSTPFAGSDEDEEDDESLGEDFF